MKILHTVEFYHPSSGGSQEVVRQLSERMAGMGHDVTVATSRMPQRKFKELNHVKIEEFNIKGNHVIGITGEIKQYQDFLINSDFDVIMNYAAQQWATDLVFPIIDKIKARKIFVPCGYSALTNPAFSEYFKQMPSILRKYNASIYLSNDYRDINFARKHKINSTYIIPNGANENEFHELIPKSIFRKKNNIRHFFILSVGNHTGVKGHAEMLKVFRYFPFPSTFVIVGNAFEGGCYHDCLQTAEEITRTQKRLGKKVMVLGLDRQETVNALKSADIFFFLSNVEASPLVLFEAAAAGLPFIASSAGNSAEIAQWTKSGIIAASYPDLDRPGNVIVSEKDTLKKLIKLYSRRNLRKRMSANGRKIWQENFTWQKIAQEYLKVYEGAGK